MFSTMKIAAVALLSVSSLVSGLPNTPPSYGGTTTSSSTQGDPTQPPGYGSTTSCWTISKTSTSTGVTTLTSYKPITTYVPTTYKTNVPKTYTKKDRTKITGISTITRPFSGPYTSTSVGYSTSDEVTTRVTTVGKKPITTTIVSTILVDDVRTEKSTIKHTLPVTSVRTGVTSGVTTITKPYTDYSYTIVTRTKNGHTTVVTSVPKVTSSLCSQTKPYTTTYVKTEQKCTTKRGW